jgi:ribosomal protein L11 methyltransferase
VAAGSPTGTDHRWWTVVVTVHPSELELVSDRAWARGADAIGEVQLDADRIELTISTPEPATAAEIALATGGNVVEVTDSSWLDAWRAAADITRVGSLLVQPVWLPPATTGSERVVLLDPGHAFGDGSHPTTRACLAFLDAVLARGSTVLDLGCGSGVLTAAAALLGASCVEAVDIDEHARRVTAANAVRNGVDAQVVVRASLADVIVPIDVVVANIGANALVELAGPVTGVVHDRSLACLAGVLADREIDVRSAWERDGWQHESTEADGPWVAIRLCRAARDDRQL